MNQITNNQNLDEKNLVDRPSGGGFSRNAIFIVTAIDIILHCALFVFVMITSDEILTREIFQITNSFFVILINVLIAWALISQKNKDSKVRIKWSLIEKIIAIIFSLIILPSLLFPLSLALLYFIFKSDTGTEEKDRVLVMKDFWLILLLVISWLLLSFGYYGSVSCLSLAIGQGEDCMVLFISLPALVLGVILYIITFILNKSSFKNDKFWLYNLIFTILASSYFIYWVFTEITSYDFYTITVTFLPLVISLMALLISKLVVSKVSD